MHRHVSRDFILLCWGWWKKFVTRVCAKRIIKLKKKKKVKKVKNWRNLTHCLVINFSDLHCYVQRFCLTNNFIVRSKILSLRARRNVHSNRELIASDNNFAVYTFTRFSNSKIIVSLFSREKSRLLAVNDTAIFSTEIVAIKLRNAYGVMFCRK